MATANEIHRLMTDAWNRRDWNGVRALVHDEYSYTGGDGKVMTGGPDVAVAIGQMYAKAFSDARLEVQRVIVQGHQVVAEMLATGTHTGELQGIAPTGKRITLPICNVVELRDGKIYREREYFDGLHLMTQLGVIAPPKR